MNRRPRRRARHAQRLRGGSAGLATLCAMLAGLAVFAGGCADDTPEKRPNVLLIVLDTVRRDRLSTYGYLRATTPNLTRLAAAGARYDDVLAPAPWTVPSHATLMTGQPPAVHGAHHEHPVLGPELETLAERFTAAGWHTAGFSANPFVGRPARLDRGFERFERIDAGGRAVNRAALDFIAASPEPWFVFLNFMETHMPYAGLPEDVRLRFMPGTPESEKLAPLEAQIDAHLYACGEKVPSPELLARLGVLYDAALAHLDAIVGELFDALDPVASDTVVIVVSDHGELLGEHGRVEHQWTVLDPLLRVPLIVRAPGRIEPGSVVDTPIGLRDVHDLVLELAGLATDEEVHSTSVEGEERVAEYYRPMRLLKGVGELDPACAARLDRRLIAVHEGRYKLEWSSTGAPRLFDLAADPGESTDVADAYPGVAEELTKVAQARRRLAGEAASFEGVPALADEERERLRALGYLPGLPGPESAEASEPTRATEAPQTQPAEP